MTGLSIVGRRIAARRLPPLLMLAIGACAPLPEVPPTPPPSTPVLSERYLIQPGDQLDVTFRHNPELNEQVTVQPDGRFSVQLAHDVQAAGRSVQEVTQEVAQAYRQELRDPAVTVQLRNALPTRVYVGGEVNAPGEYVNVGPSLTVVQAIARAGGLKNSANQERIILVRRGPDGRGQPFGVDYVAAAGGASDADVRLAPYDTLFVPRSGVANVYLAYEQYFKQFLPSNLGFAIPLN